MSPIQVDLVLGTTPRLVLAQGGVFSRQAAMVLLELLGPELAELARLTTAAPTDAPWSKISMGSFLRDDNVPLRVREAFLDGARASIAMLGIVLAVERGKRLPAWLAFALCETFTEGQRHLLRVYAGMPEAPQVPESVLPRSEWFDLADLGNERAAWEAHVDSLPASDAGPPADEA